MEYAQRQVNLMWVMTLLVRIISTRKESRVGKG
jgi:hypothetical protein